MGNDDDYSDLYVLKYDVSFYVKVSHLYNDFVLAQAGQFFEEKDLYTVFVILILQISIYYLL